MTLEEMLEYTAAQYLDDRTDLIEGDSDELWSDSFIVRQFNEATRLLARDAWCIVTTGEPGVGIVVLRAGVSLYTLDNSILRVMDATPSTQTMPLGRTEDLQIRDTNLNLRPGEPFDAWEVGQQAAAVGSDTLLSGVTLAFATDAGTRTMRAWPPPTSDQNGVQVSLRIARLPVKWLTLDDTSAEPETPRDYDLQICEYAAGKCLTQPTVDGMMKADGRALLAAFEVARRDARRDRQRAEMQPARWGFSSVTALLR